MIEALADILVQATKASNNYASDRAFYVPYGTEVIASRAFGGIVYNLTSIYIPTTVKYIAPDAFQISNGGTLAITGISDEAIFPKSSAVREISNDNNEELEEVARYDVNGMKIDENAEGIQIIQYDNGSSKKVLK